MRYTCIGKRRGEHGAVVDCANVSESPTKPDRPEWGYLCPQCLGTQYGRQPLRLDLPDMDKPNQLEREHYGVPIFAQGRDHVERIEREELEDLRLDEKFDEVCELDLDIDLAY